MPEPRNPLRRSRRHRWIAGVCGGLAEWLGWNPTLVRFLYVVVSVVSVGFPGHAGLHRSLVHHAAGGRLAPMAVYAIGDIQGCYLTLQKILIRIGYDP